jgi:3-oxoacyl-[acyl-carrier protein] reductase
MRALDGKVALITGSGRGMGRAHAVLLAERGADIMVHDLRKEEADETADLVRQKGRRALVSNADVADVAAMRDYARRGEKELGRIDILVNNAGIGAERTGIEGVTLEWWQRMLDIHVKGSFFTTQAVVPGMKARKFGKILNVSSMWSMTGNPYGASYIAAKSALLGLTRAWALELAAWNICVNAVAPGSIYSQMVIERDGLEAAQKRWDLIPLKRPAQPEEIAYSVAFLCSGESDFITGQVLSQNGGFAIVGI